MEIYGRAPIKCSRCDEEYEPGIMYRHPHGLGMPGNGLCIVPIKCMKCPKCGESRLQTREEYEVFSEFYQRIE